MNDRVTHVGGCQCGAVRFAATGSPLRVSLCHCRMCQRASGNAFAPLAEWRTRHVKWSGAPKTFASSDISERGFCSDCGTPLFLRDVNGDTIELMLGALAAPESFAPAYHYGIESRIPWLDEITELPGHCTGSAPDEIDFSMPQSRQAALTTEQ